MSVAMGSSEPIVSRILVVSTAFLGDIVLTSPVVTNLRNLYPDAEIDYLTTPATAPLVRFHPALHEVLEFDKRRTDRGLIGLKRMSDRLRARRYDIVFSLHKSWRTALMLWLSGIPVRYGFDDTNGRFFYTRTASQLELVPEGLEHAALRNLAILRCLDLDISQLDSSLSLEPGEAARTRVKSFLADRNVTRPIVSLVPSSVWPTKRWPADRFGALASELVRNGFQPVVLAGKGDAETVRLLLKVCPEAIDCSSEFSLLDSAAMIALSAAVISNDSGPVHFASAANVPAVEIFCATVPEFGFGPWKNVAEVVEVSGLPCRPCGRHGGLICPTGTHACQLGVSIEDVYSAFQRVLKNTPNAISSSRFVSIKRGKQRLLTRYGEDFEALERITEPSSGLPIDGGRGATFRVAFTSAEKQRSEVVLRRYQRGGFARRLSSDLFFSVPARQSRSEQELRVLDFLSAFQMPVPRPIASVTSKAGLLRYRSTLIMESVTDARSLVELARQELLDQPSESEALKQACYQAGTVARRILQLGVVHPDLHPGNVLLQDKKVWIIDFDRAWFRTGLESENNIAEAIEARWKRYVRKYNLPPGWIEAFERGHRSCVSSLKIIENSADV